MRLLILLCCLMFLTVSISAATTPLTAYQFAIRDADSRQPISDALMSVQSGGKTVWQGYTTSYGFSSGMHLPANETVSLTVSKDGYETTTQSLRVQSLRTRDVLSYQIYLKKSAKSTPLTPVASDSQWRKVRLSVDDSRTNQPLKSALIEVRQVDSGKLVWSSKTYASGETPTGKLKTNQTYHITYSKDGYATQRVILTIPQGTGVYTYGPIHLSSTAVRTSSNAQQRSVADATQVRSASTVQSRTATDNVEVRFIVTRNAGTDQQGISGASVRVTADGRTYSVGKTDAVGKTGPLTLQRGQSGVVRISRSGYPTLSQSFSVDTSGNYYYVFVNA